MFFLARHDAGLPCRRPMISRTASIAYNVRRMVPVDAGSWLTHGICHSRIMAPCELLSDVRLGGQETAAKKRHTLSKIRSVCKTLYGRLALRLFIDVHQFVLRGLKQFWKSQYGFEPRR